MVAIERALGVRPVSKVGASRTIDFVILFQVGFTIENTPAKLYAVKAATNTYEVGQDSKRNFIK